MMVEPDSTPRIPRKQLKRNTVVSWLVFYSDLAFAIVAFGLMICYFSNDFPTSVTLSQGVSIIGKSYVVYRQYHIIQQGLEGTQETYRQAGIASVKSYALRTFILLWDLYLEAAKFFMHLYDWDFLSLAIIGIYVSYHVYVSAEIMHTKERFLIDETEVEEERLDSMGVTAE
ncbi:hypothetical protein CRE_10971 [Caenorhabditis remanei]|uniref:Uncharacterized protein n=1 Tax=Caenorhabditis remanei TaxID=31234 RepID=E3M5T0_CAERE|nr:hypothetical protein CRE_10971 [Caenorhabditis remanei]